MRAKLATIFAAGLFICGAFNLPQMLHEHLAHDESHPCDETCAWQAFAQAKTALIEVDPPPQVRPVDLWAPSHVERPVISSRPRTQDMLNRAPPTSA